MSTSASVVAVYETHERAGQAMTQLQEAGVLMKNLSIAAKDMQTGESVVGCYHSGGEMQYLGKAGTCWDGFRQLLSGSALFVVPGMGSVLVAGPLVNWIVEAHEGAATTVGLSAIGAGLFSAGVPRESVLRYDTALKNDTFVLVFQGRHDAVFEVENVLSKTEHNSCDYHGVPALSVQ